MILSRYKKYIKSVSQYFSASMIPMVLSLAINPLLALNMSPEDYAIMGYYTSYTALFSPLVVFFMLHYYTKRYFEVTDDEREVLKAMIVKSLIYFSGILAVICYVGLYIYHTCLNAQSSMQFFPYAMLSVFALPFSGIYNLMLCDMRMSRQSGRYMRISIAAGIVLCGINLLLVVVFKWGAFGKLLSQFVVNVVFFIFGFIYFKDQIHLSFDFSQFKKMFQFCLPLTIAAMLSFFTSGYDRVFLERLGNTVELGYYSVGVTMAGYISVFQNAIGNTFQPDLFQAIVQKDRGRLFKVGLLIVGSTAAVVSIFIIAAPLVVKILTAGRYMLSVKYTQIAALSILTSAMYYMVSQITIALGKSQVTLVTKILTSVCCIAMYSASIRKFEFMGAAWGLVFSYLISLVINLLVLWISKLIKQ